ncbi:uncharacterized protein [Cicer arietinum]|uniref:uncharacterized protein n=1 Tax=Cicer arietinum TaxID=3827 RepID=UPI003CC5413D
MSTDEITGTSSFASNYNKPFQFEGSHFKRWQQKMMFFLTTKKLANVLKDDIPVVPEKGEQAEKDKIANDYLRKNYILNGLADDLYDYYSSESNTAKQDWDALKKKYDTEEAGAKKYVFSRYLKYQMTDQRKLNLMKSRKLLTRSSLKESRKQDQKDEIILVANNKKKKFIGAVLKLNGKQMKNQNRTSKNINKNGNPPKVPIARQPPPPRNDPLPFLCFYCGKKGHMTPKCRNKSGAANHVNLTEEQFVAMITEINLVGGSDGWWIDTGASHHVCYDHAMFKTYTAAEDKKVLLGDSHTTNVADIGDVELIFTSGKTLILKDVMHTPEIRKNLVSGFRLNKAGFT